MKYISTNNPIKIDELKELCPWQQNRSRGVECVETQNKIKLIVNKLVQE